MAKPFRLYVCSDIHASERTWRKFVNAMKAHGFHETLRTERVHDLPEDKEIFILEFR